MLILIRDDISIRPERAEDFSVIRELVRRAFAEHTPYSDGSGENALIDEIRQKRWYRPELSFVAELDGQIVGHFMFSDFPLSPSTEGGWQDKQPELLMLAPVAVHADHFRQGIGETMLRLGLAIARKTGCRGITVEGDFHFYNRLGFVTSARYGIHAASGFPLQEPRCMMVQEAYPGSLEGVSGYVVYDMYENA